MFKAKYETINKYLGIKRGLAKTIIALQLLINKTPSDKKKK